MQSSIPNGNPLTSPAGTKAPSAQDVSDGPLNQGSEDEWGVIDGIPLTQALPPADKGSNASSNLLKTIVPLKPHPVQDLMSFSAPALPVGLKATGDLYLDAHQNSDVFSLAQECDKLLNISPWLLASDSVQTILKEHVFEANVEKYTKIKNFVSSPFVVELRREFFIQIAFLLIKLKNYEISYIEKLESMIPVDGFPYGIDRDLEKNFPSKKDVFVPMFSSILDVACSSELDKDQKSIIIKNMKASFFEESGPVFSFPNEKFTKYYFSDHSLIAEALEPYQDHFSTNRWVPLLKIMLWSELDFFAECLAMKDLEHLIFPRRSFLENFPRESFLEHTRLIRDQHLKKIFLKVLTEYSIFSFVLSDAISYLKNHNHIGGFSQAFMRLQLFDTIVKASGFFDQNLIKNYHQDLSIIFEGSKNQNFKRPEEATLKSFIKKHKKIIFHDSEILSFVSITLFSIDCFEHASSYVFSLLKAYKEKPEETLQSIDYYDFCDFSSEESQDLSALMAQDIPMAQNADPDIQTLTLKNSEELLTSNPDQAETSSSSDLRVHNGHVMENVDPDQNIQPIRPSQKRKSDQMSPWLNEASHEDEDPITPTVPLEPETSSLEPQSSIRKRVKRSLLESFKERQEESLSSPSKKEVETMLPGSQEKNKNTNLQGSSSDLSEDLDGHDNRPTSVSVFQVSLAKDDEEESEKTENHTNSENEDHKEASIDEADKENSRASSNSSTPSTSPEKRIGWKKKSDAEIVEEFRILSAQSHMGSNPSKKASGSSNSSLGWGSLPKNKNFSWFFRTNQHCLAGQGKHSSKSRQSLLLTQSSSHSKKKGSMKP